VLVEAHGGTISAESALGHGSVYCVTLPYGFSARDEQLFMTPSCTWA
jgi:signal transduction histidine kinase